MIAGYSAVILPLMTRTRAEGLYEGTTGIQSLDLFFRTAADGGALASVGIDGRQLANCLRQGRNAALCVPAAYPAQHGAAAEAPFFA